MIRELRGWGLHMGVTIHRQSHWKSTAQLTRDVRGMPMVKEHSFYGISEGRKREHFKPSHARYYGQARYPITQWKVR